MLNVSAESRITLTLSENTLHDFYWTKVVLSKDLDDSSYCQLYANSRVVNPSDLVGNHYALSDVTSVSKLCEVEHILRQFKVNNSRCFICYSASVIKESLGIKKRFRVKIFCP